MLTCSPSWVVISVSGIAAYCLFSLYIIPIITMQIGAVRAQTAAILARFCRSMQKQEHIMPRADYFTARGTTVLYLPLDMKGI